MPDKITYYAVIGGERTIDNPYGLVRRLEFDGNGFTDEGLRKDFSWAFSPAIVEWKHGDFGEELVEVSHEQARRSSSISGSGGGRSGSRWTLERRQAGVMHARFHSAKRWCRPGQARGCTG